MKAWKSECLGEIYIHEILKNNFFCKILDLIRTGESEITRERLFVQGCVGKSKSHEDAVIGTVLTCWQCLTPSG